MSSSSQTKPLGSLQGVGVASNKKLRKVYSCLVCGKSYTYLVSFRKHQQLHENQPPPTKSQCVENLNKYECPECGMSFIRRARLLGHLRIHRSHRSFKSKPPRCDQCNKDFTSVQSWIAHNDLHEQKPFWCLSCAKGFIDEKALDKHLQRHNLGQHVCNICHKSFQMVTELRNHYKTHTGAKPYQCTLCGKSFSFLGNLISHRKKHLKVYVGSNGMPLGIKNSAFFAKKRVVKKKSLILTSIKEEPEMDVHMAGKEECVEKSEPPCEEDHADSEESDCGEPMHHYHFKPSKPPGMVGSGPPDESKSKTVDQQAGQELDERETHKYWEWECCECDMGFDEVAKLHLHYIKHATGELPIPQDYIEG